jgi:rhamnosyltransferase
MNNFAIVVCFNPNVLKLQDLISAVLKSNYKVILVDNSDTTQELISISNNQDVFLLSNGENLGIAKAQNIGVKFAIKSNAKIISFFDQDSEINTQTLSLLNNFVQNNASSIAVPIILNKTTQKEYPSYRISFLGKSKKIYSLSSKTNNTVDIAISSGTTLNIDTFLSIGYFDEGFFIDFVDIEWFYRAKKKLVKTFVISNSFVFHSIGEGSRKFLFINILKHTPVRTYYKVRNSFLLFKKRTQFLFSIRQIIPSLIHNFILSWISSSKKAYFKFFFLGIFHGLVGIEGRIHSKYL